MILPSLCLFFLGWYLCWVTDIPRPRLSQDILGWIGVIMAWIGIAGCVIALFGKL